MFDFSASIIIINIIVVVSLSVIKLDIIGGAFFGYTVDKSNRLAQKQSTAA